MTQTSASKVGERGQKRFYIEVLVGLCNLQVDGLDACPYGTARGRIAEQLTTQHVNDRLDTISAWLTGSFTLLLVVSWRAGLTSLTVSAISSVCTCAWCVCVTCGSAVKSTIALVMVLPGHGPRPLTPPPPAAATVSATTVQSRLARSPAICVEIVDVVGRRCCSVAVSF